MVMTIMAVVITITTLINVHDNMKDDNENDSNSNSGNNNDDNNLDSKDNDYYHINDNISNIIAMIIIVRIMIIE